MGNKQDRKLNQIFRYFLWILVAYSFIYHRVHLVSKPPVMRTILFSVFLFANSVFAQDYTINALRALSGTFPRYSENKVVIDSVQILANYSYRYAVDTAKGTFFKDDHILELGQTHMKYYSHFADMEDSLLYKARQKGQRNYKRLVLKENEKAVWADYYMNYPEAGTLTATVRFNNANGDFLYKEEIPTQNWILEQDTLTVLSYKCQKAQTRFRGRNYTAWFAPEIPLSNGPWKFGGLPGLILKVYDDHQYFVFECTGIEYLATKKPMYFMNSDYIKAMREKVRKADKSRHSDVTGFLQTVGIRMQIGDNTDKTRVFSVPYIPMELE